MLTIASRHVELEVLRRMVKVRDESRSQDNHNYFFILTRRASACHAMWPSCNLIRSVTLLGHSTRSCAAEIWPQITSVQLNNVTVL